MVLWGGSVSNFDFIVFQYLEALRSVDFSQTNVSFHTWSVKCMSELLLLCSVNTHTQKKVVLEGEVELRKAFSPHTPVVVRRRYIRRNLFYLGEIYEWYI